MIPACADDARPGVVGLIGAGEMGLPILGHIAAAGFAVRCLDTSAEKAALAAAAGAEPVTSYTDLAGCEAVLVFVPTDDDVRAVAAQAIAVLPPAAIVVVCSSVTTATCRTLAEHARPAGVRVVDAALTGGIRAAVAGQISLMVGGADADVARLQPLFASFCAKVNVLGPLGSGQVGKTVNNLIHWGQIVTVAEALSFGSRLGVPVARMRAALAGGPTDSATLHDLEHMRFTWFDKDIGNALTMAEDAGYDLVVGPFARALMHQVSVAAMAGLLADDGVIEFDAPDTELRLEGSA